MSGESRKEKQRLYKLERARRMRTINIQLTHERLLQVVSYDPVSGLFFRSGCSGKRTDLVGKLAGGASSDGYVRVAVDDKRYRAHRLAWFYMTGSWPNGEIDHIDGVPTNNKWSNLREATSSINKQNRHRASKSNKIGLLGVTKASCSERFRARIDGEHLGVFDTPEEAHAAYLVEKRKRHEGCTL